MTTITTAERTKYTLKDVQDLLKVKQHVIIHLCEKKVITPEFQNTTGRGKWRLFSKENLLEFLIAMNLGQLGVPVKQRAILLKIFHDFLKTTYGKPQHESDKVFSNWTCQLPITFYFTEGRYLTIRSQLGENFSFDINLYKRGTFESAVPEVDISKASVHLQINLSIIAADLANLPR